MRYKINKNFFIKIVIFLIGVIGITLNSMSYASLESTTEIYSPAVIIEKPVSDEKCVLPSVTIKGEEKVDDTPETINWSIIANSYADTTTSNSEEEKVFSIDLPSDNDKFGDNAIKAKASARGTDYEDTVDTKFFFNKSATDNPGSGNPNWYYYWSQTSANTGSHQYDNSGSAYGYYNPGDSHFYICSPAGTNIDEFAKTCIHENTHLTDWQGFWPSGYNSSQDGDGDQIPDSLEPGLGFDPLKFDTDPYDEWPYDFADYSEPRAYAAEDNWTDGSADGKDWASPGHQF